MVNLYENFIADKLKVFVLEKQLIIAPSYLTKAKFTTQFCLDEIGNSDVLKNTIDEWFAFFLSDSAGSYMKQ